MIDVDWLYLSDQKKKVIRLAERKKTLVLGASPNPVRFSYKAVKSLLRNDQEVVAVGFKEGLIEDEKILVGMPPVEGVQTVSVYIGSSRQADYYDYIISLKPERVIFNPGTVNPEFMARLKREGIEPVAECMLVLLNEGKY
jgi:predicted CoA-binding protein